MSRSKPKEMLKPSELQFSIHSLKEIDGEDNNDFMPEVYGGLNIITFCPIEYWKESECLPDYYLSDLIGEELLPDGYNWYICVEETQWCSKKSKDEIRADLTKIGFVESKEMTEFLSNCW